MSKLNGQEVSTSSRWELCFSDFFDVFFAQYTESFDLDLTAAEFIKAFGTLQELIGFFALASVAYQVNKTSKLPNIEVGNKGPVLSFKTSVRKGNDRIEFNPQLAADLFNYIISAYEEDEEGNLTFCNTTYDDEGKLSDQFQLLYLHNGVPKGLKPSWNYNSLECVGNTGLPTHASEKTFKSISLNVSKVIWKGKVIFNISVK